MLSTHRASGTIFGRMLDARERSLVVVHASDPRLRDRAFPVGARLTIGRREQAGTGLVIDDKLLSGVHASIERTAGGYELVDHKSKNGSFVDGIRVERKRLSDGSIVRLGVHLFEFSSAEGSLEPFDATVEGDQTFALVGRSPALRRLVSGIDAAVHSVGPLLLVGEHGAGKEAAGRRLHALAGRSGAFVSLACGTSGQGKAGSLLFGDPFDAGEGEDGADLAARGVGGTRIVPPDLGLVVRANGGTLLLDGVDALDLATQERLAAFVRDGMLALPSGDLVRLDVQLIAAAEVDLEPLVEDGSFSPSLFEQLHVNTLELPPLRARRGDIPVLLKRIWSDIARGASLEVSATALEKLLIHDWPMNVREVATVLSRVFASVGAVDVLRSAHLPTEIRERVHFHSADQLRASAVNIQVVPSREELTKLLKKFNGDVASMASFFARDKRQVYRWLKRHDLKLSAFRAPAS